MPDKMLSRCSLRISNPLSAGFSLSSFDGLPQRDQRNYRTDNVAPSKVLAPASNKDSNRRKVSLRRATHETHLRRQRALHHQTRCAQHLKSSSNVKQLKKETRNGPHHVWSGWLQPDWDRLRVVGIREEVPEWIREGVPE